MLCERGGQQEPRFPAKKEISEPGWELGGGPAPASNSPSSTPLPPHAGSGLVCKLRELTTHPLMLCGPSWLPCGVFLSGSLLRSKSVFLSQWELAEAVGSELPWPPSSPPPTVLHPGLATLLCREQEFSTRGIRLDRLWWLGCLSSPSHSPASLPLPFPPPTLPSKPLPVSGRSLRPPSGKKLMLGATRLAHLPSPLTLNC